MEQKKEKGLGFPCFKTASLLLKGLHCNYIGMVYTYLRNCMCYGPSSVYLLLSPLGAEETAATAHAAHRDDKHQTGQRYQNHYHHRIDWRYTHIYCREGGIYIYIYIL
jgi:hypothetical protein